MLDVLDRDFHAPKPNYKWAGDISYIWIREDWLYLAVILNLFLALSSGGPSATA